ncbi:MULTISPECIES: CBS domain-containing protein [Thermoactinomyces]|jgi:CBS-domain-containing membrane protein|uniref:CBS domain-containing protein n=1 Tax=Thermoactinomyces daqus TaxID=1329516 RepID=A0A7W1XD28_9BACL|nr:MULTISPECIES: CBS domain-containing protein [Thermoactinomyces]MBA4544461.1 CBS domain-containing protein [Thermoactinomyces daqus]MBH8599032.1 CBS domain-containing protein [Thermoactinomyces sp. CICC 10523]MBH8605019.1 CBS domain-containing protein [Thermoactinomyces sp. CICC 10522]MBH8608459.1 CBS domain-containing protein [Thermoactinomyces sp. CICC 10521]
MLKRDQAGYLFSREITPFIIPKEKVVVVDPDWSLERALLVLTRKATNSVPVINQKGQIDGIISKTDILDFLLKMEKKDTIDFSRLGKHKVKDAMDKNHSGILANSIFSFAFEVLVNRSYIPIIDLKGQFVGILTRKVMMEQVIEYFKKEYMETIADQV